MYLYMTKCMCICRNVFVYVEIYLYVSKCICIYRNVFVCAEKELYKYIFICLTLYREYISVLFLPSLEIERKAEYFYKLYSANYPSVVCSDVRLMLDDPLFHFHHLGFGKTLW